MTEGASQVKDVAHYFIVSYNLRVGTITLKQLCLERILFVVTSSWNWLKAGELEAFQITKRII